MQDFDELRSDVKEIKQEVRAISETLLRNTLSLELHEKRTNLAEKRIDAHDSYRRWEVGLLISAMIGLMVKLFIR